MWPFPQSTACEVSAGLRPPELVRNNGDMGLSLSGRRTARPQAGYGHHLIDGLLSTKAYSTQRHKYHQVLGTQQSSLLPSTLHISAGNLLKLIIHLNNTMHYCSCIYLVLLPSYSNQLSSYSCCLILTLTALSTPTQIHSLPLLHCKYHNKTNIIWHTQHIQRAFYHTFPTTAE